MTAPNTLELAGLDRMFAEATPGEWQWTMRPMPTPDDAKNHLCEVVNLTEGFTSELHGVGTGDLEGDWLTTAYTGCGPDGSANARLIVALHESYPALRAQLQADADELARLREALASIADFAVGYGDVCEIIASRARAALLGIAP